MILIFKYLIDIHVSLQDKKTYFVFVVRVDEVFHGINVNEPDNSLPSPPANLCVVTYIWLKYRNCDVQQTKHGTSVYTFFFSFFFFFIFFSLFPFFPFLFHSFFYDFSFSLPDRSSFSWKIYIIYKTDCTISRSAFVKEFFDSSTNTCLNMHVYTHN